MTEEIIVDGVNVAGCEYFCKYGNSCSFKQPFGFCKSDNCYYKQLKQLEQERDELKKTVENQKLEYEELQCDLSEVENACGCYQSENAKLKQENKDLKKQIESDKGLITVGGKQQYQYLQRIDELEQENKELKDLNKKICEDWEKEIKVYWNALEEIREIVTGNYEVLEPQAKKDIENKINEVINESN